MSPDRIGRRRALVMLGATVAIPRRAAAQWQPIDLGIPNLPQVTPVWCWAAVAEQIIRWRNGGQGPSQPELVSIANGFPPQACLAPPHPGIYQACLRTGGLQEIQGLIARFGGGASFLSPPAHPVHLYQTLSQGRPVILAVQTTPFAGHVVVLRGMMPAWDPMLLINDPMRWSTFGQPMPFSMLMGFWRAAIVVV